MLCSKSAPGIPARESLRRIALSSASLLALSTVISAGSASAASPAEQKAGLAFSQPLENTEPVDDLTVVAQQSIEILRSFTTAAPAYDMQASSAEVCPPGYICVTNSAPLTTTLTAYANSFGRDGAYAAVMVTNSGAITTSGTDAPGIFAGSFAVSFFGSGAVTKVTNYATIVTSGNDSAGIVAKSRAYSAGRNLAETYVKNTAAITTSGTGSPGIAASSSGYTAVTNSGAIATAGNDSGGISALSFTYTTVTNSGAITTAGGYSTGILAEGGYATVSNSGAITTSGIKANGISAYSTGKYGSFDVDKTSVANSGAITTAGIYADGIGSLATAITSGSSLAVAADTVRNSGAIVTSGDYAKGILASSYAGAGVGDMDTANSATVVTNSAAITTSGKYAPAIDSLASASVVSFGSSSSATAADTVTNSGAIVTSGDYSAGIAALGTSNALSYPESSASAAATTTVTNSGSITTSGIRAFGITAYSTADSPGPVEGAVNVTNSAPISTSGSYAAGIVANVFAESFGTAGGTATAAIAVTNSGNITVTGRHATGIVASTYAQAFSAGRGLFVPGSTSTTVTNSGKITASGYNSTGIVVLTGSTGIATVNNSGVVTGGRGSYSAGIYGAGSYTIAINNAGTVQAYGHHAIDVPNPDNGTLTNSGTIIGYLTLRGGTVNMLNSGIWVAGGGTSEFTATVSKLTNTGTIVAFGSQTFTGLSTFDNTGLLDLSANGSAPYVGMGPGALGTRLKFETLEISGNFVGGQGSEIAIGSDMLSRADVLKVDGTVSGATRVTVEDNSGTPGLTTGNGILVATAANFTSPGNFSIFGNTGAHTLVDGGYEYDLAFAPGGGRVGDWYLQGRIFPGVYQFAQIGSSELMTAQLANGMLLDFFPRAQQAADQASLASLQQPVQLTSNDPTYIPGTMVPLTLAGWGGGNYDNMSIRPHESLAADYQFRGQAAQIGVDDTWQNLMGSLVLGVYAAPVRASSDFYHFDTAHIVTDGVAYGAYGIWLQGPLEAGLRFSFDTLNSHFVDYYLGSSSKTNNRAWDIDAAVSYDVRLAYLEDYGIHLQPQAEFNYTRAGGTSFADGAIGYINEVNVSGTRGFQGLFEARLSKSYQLDTTLLTPHIGLGVLYQGDAQTSVTIGNFHAATNIQGVSGSFGGGVDVNLSRDASLFFNGDYLPGDHIQGWRAFAGLRWSFFPPAEAAPAAAPPPSSEISPAAPAPSARASSGGAVSGGAATGGTPPIP